MAIAPSGFHPAKAPSGPTMNDIYWDHVRGVEPAGLVPGDVGRTLRLSVDVYVRSYTPLAGGEEQWQFRPIGAPTLEAIPIPDAEDPHTP